MKKLIFIGVLILLASGCQSTVQPYDYTAFRSANPGSILVVPPINNSVEVNAPYGMLAQVITPIAEAGYYVYPVAVVQQTFIANGMTVPQDIHNIAPMRLHEIYGADAGLFITINDYGTSYVVIGSDTTVSASARLVDLRTGVLLWQGAARASSSESRDSNSTDLLHILVSAALTQIVDTLTDRGFDIAGVTAWRMLSVNKSNGLLAGPRSPRYGQESSNPN